MLETDDIIVMTVTGNFDIDVIILIAKNAKPKIFFGVMKRMFNTLYRYLMMVIDLIFRAGLLI